MQHQRTIELRLLEGFTDSAPLTDPNVERAIGYLATWAVGGGRFKTVRIGGDKDGNLDALYLKDDGSLGYEIGAIRREDGTYSFHS